MNRKPLFALALAAFASGAAVANDIEPASIAATPFVSTASRAQVQQELVRFKQAGVNPWSNRYDPLRRPASERTRAEVRADFIASRERVASFTGEDSGSRYLAEHRGEPTPQQIAGKPTRAE